MSTTSEVYLSRVGSELVLNYGANPMQHVGRRVLVVGGGVTGLTVGDRSRRATNPD